MQHEAAKDAKDRGRQQQTSGQHESRVIFDVHLVAALEQRMLNGLFEYVDRGKDEVDGLHEMQQRLHALWSADQHDASVESCAGLLVWQSNSRVHLALACRRLAVPILDPSSSNLAELAQRIKDDKVAEAADGQRVSALSGHPERSAERKVRRCKEHERTIRARQRRNDASLLLG